MKVLHLIPSLNPSGGGPPEFIKNIILAQDNLGVISEILCFDNPNSKWLAQFDKKFKVITFGSYWPTFINKIASYIWMIKNAKKYDALVVHGLWSFTGPLARICSIKLNVKYYVFTHGMLDPWFKQYYPLKHFKKWLYWPWFEYQVLRDAYRVIFTCEEERMLARKSFKLYKVREVVTSFGIPDPPQNHSNLVNQFFFKYPDLKTKRIILFLGRIHEKKGCDLLIEAFSKIAHKDPRLHLMVAGPDQDGNIGKLRKKAQQWGVSKNITWPGMLQDDLKWGAFYAAELFCLPSHQENFGIAVAEALACGKPVLISNKVNIWREVEVFNAGFVENDTLDGTIALLNKWMGLNEDEKNLMRKNAHFCFSNKFHIRSAAKNILSIFQS